ncbi:hypothetical protein [Pseudomonas sp. PD9R]|uniref:hypothetical protein n=1 Tax=Pseudomonas sp. PD9R TaxID=2853534 RepID=UPI001C44D9D6|nr:hypothetical protein [Pseudomonas sp. PD9R]MBV6821312.1 hypothetical protein [Pseudomonas sp. PD9R]
MTKTYEALVVEIDEVVEDVMVLLVEGVLVKCFASYCPSKIKVGKQYNVEFEMVLPEANFLVPAHGTDAKIEMTGNGLSCVISGYLDGDVFHSFVDFMDQGIHYEYPQFNKRYVEVAVERIDVSF